MSVRYSMVIQWSEEDQAYVTTLPEFGPYSKTHGTTYEEAARNGQEVLEQLIETFQAEGQPLPEPLLFGTPVSKDLLVQEKE
jgi:predicted RNase H-like HicB family nuclease